MAPKVRDRIINAVLMVAAGSSVALLSFWLQSSDLEAQEIDGKLDKSEFVIYKETNENAHAEIRTEIKSEFNKDLTDLETRLNRQSDIRDKNLREFIKAVVE